jgi:type IV pilus assembly protein PilW
MKRLNNIGFSLIELLIVLAISGVVMGAIFQVFNSSQRAFIVQDDVAETQQNVRVAKMFLERDVRMAGSGMMDMGSPDASIIYPLEFFNSDGATGTDKITILYKKLNAEGCDPDPTGTLNSCSDLPNLTLSGTMPPTATTANIVEDLGSSTLPLPPSLSYDQWDEDCYCSGTTYTSPQHQMPFIVSTPGGNSSVLLIETTANNTGGLDNLGNAPNTVPQAPNDSLYDLLALQVNTSLTNKTLNTFPDGSTISFFNIDSVYKATYYIANNANGAPCLYRDSLSNSGELIAEHVEDLQANFGLDTTGNAVVDSWVHAPTSGAGNELSDTQKDQIRMVKISVLARTAHEHRDFMGNRPAIEDHVAGGNDGYRRRLLTFTVKVRNFGL